MNSKLFFRHIKLNILKYTIACSAMVHLFGIFLFPSWGTIPDLVREKAIQIKFMPKQPDKPVEKKPVDPEVKKEREISQPAIRPKSRMVKSAKAIHPSLAVKREPVPITSKQNFYPAKVMQQDPSVQHPVAKIHKMAENIFPAKLPPNPRLEQQEATIIASSKTYQKRKPSKVAFSDQPNIPRATFLDSQRNITGLKMASAQISLPASRANNISTPSQTPIVNMVAGNKPLKPSSFIRSQNTQPLGQGTPATPTGREISGSGMRVPSPATGIQIQSPQNLDFEISPSGQPAMAVAGPGSTYPSGSTSLLQMAAIPSGFVEETVNGKINTDNTQPSEQNISVGESNEISADQMGIIKKAFTSQVRTKIAQSKYYPRIARKRGFEGNPVVAFTLGNTGDLMEVSIKNSSSHKLLDEAALEAVKSASPYPPIPEPLKLKTIRFKLPISFILEEP